MNVRFLIRATLIASAALVAGVIYVHSLPAAVVAIGVPVRQDDFVYTVTRVAKHRMNENMAYVVTIRVDNQAKVVDYQWRDETAYVSDADGRQYRAAPDPRNGPDRPPIAAGESAAYNLTFILPVTAPQPMLRYSNGIMMGDVFDGLAYRRAAIPI